MTLAQVLGWLFLVGIGVPTLISIAAEGLRTEGALRFFGGITACLIVMAALTGLWLLTDRVRLF
jgi:hypothetical protein